MILGYPDSVATWMAQIIPVFNPPPMWKPIFDPLRDHPVYLEMLRELNLEGAVPQRTPR